MCNKLKVFLAMIKRRAAWVAARRSARGGTEQDVENIAGAKVQSSKFRVYSSKNTTKIALWSRACALTLTRVDTPCVTPLPGGVNLY